MYLYENTDALMAMGDGKAHGMTVEIPGEAGGPPEQQHRQGDVNAEEYARNARVAEALQKCMNTPSSIFAKQVSLTGADVEAYYTCAMSAHAASPPCFLGLLLRIRPSVHVRSNLFTRCGHVGSGWKKPRPRVTQN